MGNAKSVVLNVNQEPKKEKKCEMSEYEVVTNRMKGAIMDAFPANVLLKELINIVSAYFYDYSDHLTPDTFVYEIARRLTHKSNDLIKCLLNNPQHDLSFRICGHMINGLIFSTATLVYDLHTEIIKSKPIIILYVRSRAITWERRFIQLKSYLIRSIHFVCRRLRIKIWVIYSCAH